MPGRMSVRRHRLLVGSFRMNLGFTSASEWRTTSCSFSESHSEHDFARFGPTHRRLFRAEPSAEYPSSIVMGDEPAILAAGGGRILMIGSPGKAETIMS